MTRFSLTALIAIIFSSPTLAATGECATLSALERSPSKYVGKTIRIKNIACVDVKSGFLCAGQANGRLIRLESWGLGAPTPSSVAETLISRCKGEAALDRPACKFTAAFTIKDQHDRIPADLRPPQTLTIIAPTVDIFPSADKSLCNFGR